MAGGLERFKLSSAGAKKLLNSSGVQADLRARAARVAAVVDAETSDLDDWDVVHDVRSGGARARALISGVPMSVEADRRILGRAIDAAG